MDLSVTRYPSSSIAATRASKSASSSAIISVLFWTCDDFTFFTNENLRHLSLT